MVVDRLENLEKYASLNPLFAKAMEYLKTTDLNACLLYTSPSPRD